MYSAFDQRTPRSIPLPKRSVRTLLANPNYQMILAILLRTGKKNATVVPAEWVSRQYIFKQLFTFYVPSRTKKAKPDDPLVQPAKLRKGRKPFAELTHGTFSDFMRTLVDTELIDEEVSQEAGREKMFRITESGEIAFRFFSDPSTNSLIQTLLNKV